MAHSGFDVMIPKYNYIDNLLESCTKEWKEIGFVIEILILITGVLTNIGLLWMFLRDNKSLSVSQVLGVNLVAMDLIFLSYVPVNLMFPSSPPANISVVSDASEPLVLGRVIFSMFNLIGCPLLLACMCIERYLAVVRPVLYLRLRKWEYRVAVSAGVWCLTLTSCLVTGIIDNLLFVLFPVSLIVSGLFIIMLACLGSMIWTLQQSPAHTSYGNPAHLESPLKRQAVVNVLVVVVPAVISYLPVLVTAPLLLCLLYKVFPLDQSICNISELSVLFPKFGVLIGPLFYMSKARQLCWFSGAPGKSSE